MPFNELGSSADIEVLHHNKEMEILLTLLLKTPNSSIVLSIWEQFQLSPKSRDTGGNKKTKQSSRGQVRTMTTIGKNHSPRRRF